MTSPSSTPPVTRDPAVVRAAREEVRRQLMRMVLAVAVLDGLAIAAFYAFGVNHDFGARRNTFVGVWMVLTVGIVVVQLRKIRRARLAAIRAPIVSRGSSGSGSPPSGPP